MMSRTSLPRLEKQSGTPSASMKNIEAFYPLSPMQHGMLFHTVYARSSSEYSRRISFVLEGALDTNMFRSAWEAMVAEHPVLRTSFVWEGVKEPIQVVQREVPLPWEQLDWRNLSLTEQRDQWDKFLRQDEEKGFDLSRPPLIRLALIRTATNCLGSMTQASVTPFWLR